MTSRDLVEMDVGDAVPGSTVTSGAKIGAFLAVKMLLFSIDR